MERRNLATYLFAFLLLVGNAIQPDIVLAYEANASIDEQIQKGAELEKDQQWGEALTHYEEAIREFPNNKTLSKRLKITRLHFDLERRYADKSYLSILRATSESMAMELTGEVLMKIESHYYQPPNWNSILRRGTTGLKIALLSEEFGRQNRLHVTHDQIDTVIRTIWNAQIRRDFRSRQQAQDFIQWAAQTTRRTTGLFTSSTILEYMCCAAASLDTYSTYLTGDQLDEVYSQIEGNFVGLGIELKADKGSLLIAHVISKGPADRSGIHKGDRIVEVDGHSTKDISTDKAADMLKGEQGSYVKVAVLGTDGQLRQLFIRRERVEVPSVEDVKIVDRQHGIAYIKINSFQKNTSDDVYTALRSLHRQGMRKLIVDVRGNPGGLLTQSVEVADYFVRGGTIVQTRGRSSRENYAYKAHLDGTWRVPLVVLIDRDSASASEIFAGAIRDNRAGKVVGERSYGKGSVQGIFPLRSVKAGVRLTTAKFFSPADKAISLAGVEPDIVVRPQTVLRPSGEDDVASDDRDLILAAGIDTARNLMARDSRWKQGR